MKVNSRVSKMIQGKERVNRENLLNMRLFNVIQGNSIQFKVIQCKYHSR